MVEKGSPGWFSCVDGCGVLVVVVVVGELVVVLPCLDSGWPTQ